MADVTVKSQLEGLYKQVYGDKVEDLIPEVGILIKKIGFRETEKLGEAFNLPVIVADEQGATYAGPEDDAFTLNPPVAMTTKNAQVKGSQILMRAAIGYKAAAAAVQGGKAAFVNATELVMKRLINSMGKRVESMMLYGGSGLGTSASSANDDATHTTITFTAASFSPGTWVGANGVQLDAWDLSGPTLINTVAPLVVVRVNIVDKELKVSGAAADIAALDTAISGGPIDLFYFGAKGKEALGLDKIITTSGTLFNIDNSTYDLYKGQEFDAGSAALTFKKVNKAMIQLSNYGFEGDALLLCSPRTWRDLLDEQVANRRFDSSYSKNKLEDGSEELMFFCQTGRIVIKAHPMCKEGEAFIVSEDKLRRVGAWDISTKTPGYGGEIFRQLENQAGFEIRAYTDQALFTEHTSHLLKISGIVNSSS